MNMGLLGPRFTLEGHGRCVFHDPGDELSQTIWDSFEPSLMKLVGDPVQRAERGNLAEAVYCYLSHRDVGAWSYSSRPPPTWTQRLLQRLEAELPDYVVVVSTKSLTKIQKGYPFLRLAESFGALGYGISWFVASAIACGLPHDAHYSVLLATLNVPAVELAKTAARSLGTYTLGVGRTQALDQLIDERRPRLGVPRRQLSAIPSAGAIKHGEVVSWQTRCRSITGDAIKASLLRMVYPEFSDVTPCPIRLVSRHGRAGIAFKANYASFALGPGTSASPLFGVPATELSRSQRHDILNLSNWHTEREGWLVFRAPPARAVRLHGEQASIWSNTIESTAGAMGSKYALISRGLPPPMIKALISALQSHSSGTGGSTERGVGL